MGGFYLLVEFLQGGSPLNLALQFAKKKLYNLPQHQLLQCTN